MTNDDTTTTRKEPTRRDIVKYGGTAAGAGLLAGCSSALPGSGDDSDGGSGERPTATDAPYDVQVKPYEESTFADAPASYATSGGAWTDIGFAFGSEPVAMSRLGPYPTRYYDRLPGVTFETDGITDLGNPSQYGKEQFYELDVDALLMDRVLLNSYAGWEAADFAEVSENVAPFCGSYVRNEWSGEALGLEFEFPYYTLLEAISLTGELFQNQARAEAWVSLHESFRADLQSRTPGESPSIGLLYSASKPGQGEFMVTDPTLAGVATRQYRTFDVADAFADVALTNGWKTDYEGLLEADPEYLFFDSTLSMDAETFQAQYVTPLEESDVGSELTAVREGNVFRGGGRYQGPVIHLFQTEILAKQLYPDEFGVFTRGEVAADERLFDRQEVADIINGEV